MKDFFSSHGGDMILAVFAVLALIAYTVVVMSGHDSQTLGNIAIGSLAALGGYMSKRVRGAGPTTNVEQADTIAVNQTPDEETKE